MKKKGKGLSFDQKRQKLLVNQQKDVFNYQEVEKLAVKAGLPFPSVKEILESLKADSLVECQKIGAGVFYWSFPSKTFQIMNEKLAASQKQIEVYTQQIKQFKKSIEQSVAGRQQTNQRAKILIQIEQLKTNQKFIQGQIQKSIRYDPQRVELLKKQNQQLKQSANFWTDNLQQIKKYIKKNQPGIKDQDIQENYSIPTDLDYL